MGAWGYDNLSGSDGSLRLALELCDAAGNAYTGWSGPGPTQGRVLSVVSNVTIQVSRGCVRVCLQVPCTIEYYYSGRNASGRLTMTLRVLGPWQAGGRPELLTPPVRL